ncbi:MAG: hypothetical protein JWQ19_3713 [Subtercola sp.]|nr:hypothetical protein [Subtercola sp.]
MSHPNRVLASTTTPDITKSQQTMGILCDLWDNAAPGTIEYRSDLDAPRAVAIRTQTHHAVRVSRAVLQLSHTTTGIELVPLVRLVMECAVTAAWLLLTPGSGQALIRDGASQRLKALAGITKLGEDPGPAKEQAEDALAQLENAKAPRSFAFEQRCLRLEGGQRIYLTYRAFSAESHSGMGIADFYSVATPASPIGVVFNPDASSSVRTPTLGVAACMLLLAINADEIARAKPTHSTQITKAAKRLGVGTRIVASDGTELPPRV